MPTTPPSGTATAPLISVVVLNYNGVQWMERCLRSLQQQTLFSQIEVIVADNSSRDGSDTLAQKIMQGWPNGRFVQNGANFGFCEGNNRGAASATGRHLFFLNNDTWLEPNCLEILLRETQQRQAGAATPLVMNYEDDTFQSLGAGGFDIFGFPAAPLCSHADTREVMMPEGCSYLIERDLFDKLGKFDTDFFMYADELGSFLAGLDCGPQGRGGAGGAPASSRRGERESQGRGGGGRIPHQRHQTIFREPQHLLCWSRSKTPKTSCSSLCRCKSVSCWSKPSQP